MIRATTTCLRRYDGLTFNQLRGSEAIPFGPRIVAGQRQIESLANWIGMAFVVGDSQTHARSIKADGFELRSVLQV